MAILFQISWLLAIAGTFVYLLLQCMLYLGCRKAAMFSPQKQKTRPFSVIIAARNEYENLQTYLPTVLQQQYPEYEVIVVLDRNTDESETILQAFQKDFPFLKYIKIDTLPDKWVGKKYALQQGIAQAKYEYLAFTDADCRVGEAWLQEINQHFGEDTAVVLGISPYFEENTFLNQWIRFETYYTAFQMVGFAAWGFPYMGLGRNISYKKSFFLQNSGFDAFKSRLSGDDDLLVNAFAQAKYTQVMISPQSQTFSPAKMTWKAWLRQKFRHVSASTAYTPASKLLLAAFHFAHIGMYFFLFVAILGGYATFSQGILLYLCANSLKWVIFAQSTRHIQAPHLHYLYPLWDLMMVLYVALIVPIGMLRKPTWT